MTASFGDSTVAAFDVSPSDNPKLYITIDLGKPIKVSPVP